MMKQRAKRYECGWTGCEEKAECHPVTGEPVRVADPDAGVDFGVMGTIQLCKKHRFMRDKQLRTEHDELEDEWDDYVLRNAPYWDD